MDLTVIAAPLYLGAMAIERRHLVRRAEVHGPSAADYVRADTAASLAMGISSLMFPLLRRSTRPLVARRGRYGNATIGAVVAAAVATTVADAAGRRNDGPRARRVAEIGGVATIAGAGLVLSATTAHRSDMHRQWRKGQHRDRGCGLAGWTAALVGWDLIYYWNHRLMHEVRALWAIHVPHHSSQNYNLGTALRQPAASAFGVWVPYSGLARLGVRPNLIEHAWAINLIYQFWIHTDTVRSIGSAERMLNSPSHHRVHHGSNQRYLDRNHAGILMIWDRLFGTFQPELPEDPVVYGLTQNIGSHRWSTVVTHEYRQMFRDVANSHNWRDRVSFVVRRPGWASERRTAMIMAQRRAATAGPPLSRR